MEDFINGLLKELKLDSTLQDLKREVNEVKEVSSSLEISVGEEDITFQAECKKVLSESQKGLDVLVEKLEATYESLEGRLLDFTSRLAEETEERLSESLEYERGLDIALESIESLASSQGHLPTVLLRGYREAIDYSNKNLFYKCRSYSEYNAGIEESKAKERVEISKLRVKAYTFRIIRKVEENVQT